MGQPIRLVLIDHPTLSRRGLAALLGRRRGLQVVGDAENGPAGLALARSMRPDVIVVDTNVPDGGAKLVLDLRSAAPSAAVLVLTQESGSPVSRLLHAGAHGFLQKTCEPEDLVRTIERVHKGELVVASPGVELMHDAGSDGAMSNRLTGRELDVLKLVARGWTNHGIARELGITEYTAKEHLAHILDKLGLDNRVQVATYAVQRGLAFVADTHL